MDFGQDGANLQNLFEVYADLQRTSSTLKAGEMGKMPGAGSLPIDDWMTFPQPTEGMNGDSTHSSINNNTTSKKQRRETGAVTGSKRKAYDDGDSGGAYDAASSQKKQRFIWNDELHLKFIAAIFDYGLKSVSPKLILQLMEPVTSDLTTEHIKSHLQKYRVNSKRSRDEFISNMSTSFNNAVSAEAIDPSISRFEAYPMLTQPPTVLGAAASLLPSATSLPIPPAVADPPLPGDATASAIVPLATIDSSNLPTLMQHQAVCLKQLSALQDKMKLIMSVQQRIHERLQVVTVPVLAPPTSTSSTKENGVAVAAHSSSSRHSNAHVSKSTSSESRPASNSTSVLSPLFHPMDSSKLSNELSHVDRLMYGQIQIHRQIRQQQEEQREKVTSSKGGGSAATSLPKGDGEFMLPKANQKSLDVSDDDLFEFLFS